MNKVEKCLHGQTTESGKKLIDKLYEGYIPKPEELKPLLEGNADGYLFQKANEMCLTQKGREVQIRAILEFSNYCRCKCIYCGLNCNNKQVSRYRMEPLEIVNTSVKAWEAGYRTIVLQSGEDLFYTQEIICDIVSQIKEKCDISITLSIGERSYKELKAMREAGADRFLLKHETSDESLYSRVHMGDTLRDRLNCLRDIKKLGYETGGGFMVGIPGQNLDIISRDILMLREIGCDMAGIGPFISHEDTPLRGNPNGDTVMTRRALAITRLLLPMANLPATTSLGVLSPKERDLVFSSGANVIMRKVTPWSERLKYEIYPTNFVQDKDIKTARKELEEYIESLDRIPV